MSNGGAFAAIDDLAKELGVCPGCMTAPPREGKRECAGCAVKSPARVKIWKAKRKAALANGVQK